MPNNKILFIVEGETDEVNFLGQLYSQWNRRQKYEIYSYKTNIHVLAQVLYDEYPNFEEDEVDIKLLLCSMEQDSSQKEILLNKYRDVYLIFDFEPQHDNTHFDTVRRMLCFFDDSTNHGKLFINYPMMQSYKDFSKLPDDSFANKCVSIEEARNYKQLVGERSLYSDLTKYTYNTFVSIAVHHIKKANSILNSIYDIPLVDDFLKWSSQSIYDEQTSFLNIEKKIWVLNTCVFLIIDYSPNRFFSTICKKSEMFDI